MVRVDASILGVAGILINAHLDDKGVRQERLIDTCSKAFNPTESKWKTIEQECFAMIYALRHWYPILFGHPFVLERDHKNLSFLHQGSSPKVERWWMFAQSLAFTYRYIAGPENVFPDRLSRQDFDANTTLPALQDFDAEHWIGIKDTDTATKLSRPFTRSNAKVFPKDTIQVSQPTGKPVTDYEMSSPAERAEQIALVHNHLNGHHGINRTLRSLYLRGVKWKKMAKDVTQFIMECAHCGKNRTKLLEAKVERSGLGQYGLFEEISIDFIGPLPVDLIGNSYICGITCGFARYIEAFATEGQSAVIAAHCLLSIFARFGLSRRVRSDRGHILLTK